MSKCVLQKKDINICDSRRGTVSGLVG